MTVVVAHGRHEGLRRSRGDGRGQRGVASVEFVGVLPILLVLGAVMWQVLLVGGAQSAVEHAARDGSRVAGQGADEAAVVGQVHDSLPGWLASGAVTVTRPGGTAVEVTLEVPILFPGLTNSDWSVTRRAELPTTD